MCQAEQWKSDAIAAPTILYVAVVVYIYTLTTCLRATMPIHGKREYQTMTKKFGIVPLALGEYSVVCEYFNVILPLIPNLCDGKNL